MEPAEQAAHESLTLAQQMESPAALSSAYETLGRIQREAGRVVEAAIAVASEWRWARRDGSVVYRETTLANCACVRLLQARQACGLEPKQGNLPAVLPSTADH